MKVTIIIPNYNGKHFISGALPPVIIRKTCRDFKVLVVATHLLMEVWNI